MQIAKEIQRSLYQKLPEYLGIQFYNTLPPHNEVLSPFLKLEQTMCHQLLLAPKLYKLKFSMRLFSNQPSNLEVMDNFHEIKELFEHKSFFDYGEKLVENRVASPKITQDKNSKWNVFFDLIIKVVHE